MGLFDFSLYKCLDGDCANGHGAVQVLPSFSSSPLSSSSSSLVIIRSTPPTLSSSSIITSENSSIPESFSIQSLLTSLMENVRDEPWIKPLVSLSTLTISLVIVLEVLVLNKAFRRASRSPPQLFLGQLLLLALTLGSAVGFSFAFNPSRLVCALNYAAVGLVYAFIFGTLLVKCVFLLTLHSGTYLPLTYQLLLLFFIISTQVAVDVQWLLYEPSEAKAFTLDMDANLSAENLAPSAVPSRSVCSQKFTSFMYTQVYNMFLIALLAILAFRIRRHRENYREALFITISVLVTILVWLTWITGTIIFRELDRPAFIGFGLVVNCVLIFVIMFVPKALQIVKLRWYTHRHSDYNHDSSQSLCAQSFVHIKPNYHQHLHSHLRHHDNTHSRRFSGYHNQAYSRDHGQYVQHPVGSMRSIHDNGWTLNEHLLPPKTHGLHRISPNFLPKSVLDNNRHLFMGTNQRTEKGFIADHVPPLRDKDRYLRPNPLDHRLN